jgi:hypothetical protein
MLHGIRSGFITPGDEQGLLFGNPLEALYRSVSFGYAGRIIRRPDQVELEGCFRGAELAGLNFL